MNHRFFYLGSLLAISYTTAFSQIEAAQVGAEFQEVSKNAGTQIQGIHPYSSNEIKGSQFFFPTWTKGSVTSITNEVISNNYSFLYDKVRQLLFMKWQDSSDALLIQNDQIASFTLNGDKVHNFVPASKFDSANKEDFFEVLISNSNGYSLLKLTRAKFIKADFSNLQRVKDGDNYDEFVDAIGYYVSYKNGITKKLDFKEKNIEKTLPDSKQKIADYFTQNEGANKDETFLTNLIQSLNN